MAQINHKNSLNYFRFRLNDLNTFLSYSTKQLMFRFRKKNTDIYNFSNTNTRDGILPFPLRIFYIQMTSKIHIFYAEYNVSQNMQESTMICLRKKSGEFKASFSSKERKNKEIKKKSFIINAFNKSLDSSKYGYALDLPRRHVYESRQYRSTLLE